MDIWSDTEEWSSLGFLKMSKEDYRLFIKWTSMHMIDLYQNKIAYEVRFNFNVDKNSYWVKLHDESFVSMDEVLVEMKNIT